MSGRTFYPLSIVATIVAVATLAGCGGSSGTSIAITGEDQTPDPVVAEIPIAYIVRPNEPPVPDMAIPDTARRLAPFEPGAQLFLKDRASPAATTTEITRRLQPAGDDTPEGSEDLFDIRGLKSDPGGLLLVFAMRGPYLPDTDEEDQPTWNIWTYDLAADSLNRVISSDTVAEAGHDRDPAFLPDGRIIFTSTRQRTSRAILLDEGRPQFAALDEDRREAAFNLHVMDPDGTRIEQITFNQSHDQDPLVLASGQVVFTRWDNVPGRDVFSLYRMWPDGTALELLYGYHSQEQGPEATPSAYFGTHEMDDGSLLAAMRAPDDIQVASNFLLIDTDAYIDASGPVWGGSGTDGQTPLITTVTDLALPQRRGQFAVISPLRDGSDRMLVAWSQCRLLEAEVVAEGADPSDRIVPCTDERLAVETPRPAPALFGLWILDPGEEGNETQQPVVTPVEGVAIVEALALTPTTAPLFYSPATPDETTRALAEQQAGALHIRSVYDEDGVDTAVPDISTVANASITPAAARPARFLRLVKPVSIPDRDLVDLRGTAFGRSSAELMREIIGYAPIHPDGSVYVQVPANVPFAISITDGDGRRISARHRNWLQVRPGEVLTCHGCHTTDSTAPHGRLDAQPPSINTGGPYAGLADTFEFVGGDTIAEAHARADGPRAPQFDLNFTDIWTDPDLRTPDPDVNMQYADLGSPAPLPAACALSWNASCRVNIAYAEHIHPIWAVDRQTLDADGEIVTDFTCATCHSPIDADGQPRIPAAQLDLSDGPSPDQALHLLSYRELLFNDNEVEVIDGALLDRLVPVLDGDGNFVFELDEDGNLLLDLAGDPIQVFRTVGVTPVLRTNGARASAGFFSRFDAGGTHAGYLSAAELRLVSEWLDIGAQYYNDPFEVPQ